MITTAVTNEKAKNKTEKKTLHKKLRPYHHIPIIKLKNKQYILLKKKPYIIKISLENASSVSRKKNILQKRLKYIEDSFDLFNESDNESTLSIKSTRNTYINDE